MVTIPGGFDLRAWRKAAADVEVELTRLTSTLSEAQFHAPPRDGGWSMGYCIEHLVLSGQAYLPKWDLALKEAAKRTLADEKTRYGWWQRKILPVAANAQLKQKT